MSEKDDIALIDVEKIIAEKNPTLLQWMPKIILDYIKYIAHQKEFNDFLWRSRDKQAHDFVNAALQEFNITLQTIGLENIPEKGGCIVSCNHPLGGIDGIAVMHALSNRRKDMMALVNDVLMNLNNLKPLLIPVNKYGKNALQNSRIIDNAYASENCTVIFPAGLVSRRDNGKIEDSEWKKSFVTKAKKYKQPVIPVYINSCNSEFFYKLSSLRRWLGIEANLELFYLVHETYKQKGKTIPIIFGKAIAHENFDNSRTDHEWAQEVKKTVYGLAYSEF